MSGFDRELQRKLSTSMARAERGVKRDLKSMERAAEQAGRAIGDAMEDAGERGERAALKMALLWCAAAETAKKCFDNLGKTDADIDRLGRSADKMTKSFDGLQSNKVAVFLAGLTAKILAYALAAGIATAATGGLILAIVKLGAALAPIGGLVLALPAALFTAAAAFATVKLAFQGFDDVMKALGKHDLDKFNEAIAKMSPGAREFAGALRELLPHMEAMRKAVQDAFFKGLDDTLRNVAGNLLPEVRAGLVGIAGSMNAALKDVGAGLSTGAARTNIAAILESAGRSAEQLAGALRPAIEAILTLGVAGGPTIERIAAAVQRVAEQFARWATEASASGELTRILDAAVTAASTLGNILANITGIIVSVFQAGAESGAGMLQTLEKITAAANEFLNSIEGQTALQSFFASVQALADPVLDLLKAVVLVIANDLAPLLSQLAASAAPGLISFVENLGEGLRNLLPAAKPVGEAIGALAKALGPLLPLIGSLGSIILQELAIALKALSTVLEPVIKGLAGPLALALKELQPVLEEFAKGVQPVAEALGRLIADVITPLADKLPGIAATFATQLTAKIPALADAVLKLVTAFSDLAPLIGEKLADAFVIIAPELPGIVLAFADIALNVLKIAGVLTPLISDVAKSGLTWDGFRFAVQLAASILSSTASILESISGILGEINGKLRGVIKAIIIFDDALVETYNKLRDFPGMGWLPEMEKWAGAGAEYARKFADGVEKPLGQLIIETNKRLRQGLEAKPPDLGAKVQGPMPPAKAAGGRLAPAKDPLVSQKAIAAAKRAAELAKAAALRYAENLAQAGEFLADGFVTGLIGTVPQIAAAMKKMGGLVEDLLGRAKAKPMIASWADETKALFALAKNRETVAKKLTDAQKKLDDILQKSAAMSTAIAGKVRAAFDLVPDKGVKSVNTLLRQMEKAVKTAAGFTRDFAALKARGLSEALLTQLAEAGPIAGAKMAAKLSKADAGQIAALNAMSKKLEGAAGTAGTVVSNALFGAGVAAAKGLVAGLKSQQKEIEAAMMAIARGLQAAIRKALKIKSPSQIMAGIGAQVMEGLRQGILSQTSGVQAAMAGVAATMSAGITVPTVQTAGFTPLRSANPAAPPRSYVPQQRTTGTARGGGGALFNDLHLHMPTTDVEAAAQAILNRLAARVA